jgi:hypothetical protein
VYDEVREQQYKIYKRTKEQLTSKHNTIRFEEGDYCLLYEPFVIQRKHRNPNNILPPAKLTAKWSGPHLVTNKVYSLIYDILRYDNNKTQRTHANRMVLYNPWSSAIMDTSRDTRIEVDEVNINDDDVDVSGCTTNHIHCTVSEGDLFTYRCIDQPNTFFVGKLLKVREDNSLHFLNISQSNGTQHKPFSWSLSPRIC